jgi:hypothetical protein
MNQFCITSRTGDPHGDLASSNLLATATNTWEPNSNNS